MALKTAIKRAINDFSPKYRVVKVWPIKVEESGYMGYPKTMLIEVSVTKRKKK